MISFIIPAYNEETRIERRLLNLTKYFDSLLLEYEILVITDGCTDKTPKIVLDFSKKQNPKVKLITFSQRLGKGGAIIEGLKRAKGDIIVVTDADESVSPEELIKLIKELEENCVVIGSRYTYSSKLLKRESYLRYFLGRSFNALVKLMFWELRKISDTQCGAKVLRRDIVNKILDDLFIVDFTFDVNIIYAAMKRGFKVKEVGICYSHTEMGSKISRNIPRIILGMFFSLVKLKIYYSRFRPILHAKSMQKISGFLWKITIA